MSQESAGESRRVVSGAELGGCAENGDAATSQQNGGAAAGCSNVANGLTAAELLELVDAAIIALGAGESEVARARLLVLAEAIRAQGHGRGRAAFEPV